MTMDFSFSGGPVPPEAHRECDGHRFDAQLFSSVEFSGWS